MDDPGPSPLLFSGLIAYVLIHGDDFTFPLMLVYLRTPAAGVECRVMFGLN